MTMPDLHQLQTEVRRLEGDCERLQQETKRLIQRWIRLEAWWLSQQPRDSFAGIPGQAVVKLLSAALTYDDTGPDLLHRQFQECLAQRKLVHLRRLHEVLRARQDRYETCWMTLQAWSVREASYTHWNRSSGEFVLEKTGRWLREWRKTYKIHQEIPEEPR